MAKAGRSRLDQERRRLHYSSRKLQEGTPHRVADHTCPICGKQCFLSSRIAKAVASRIHPGQKMRFYTCNGKWHMTSVDAETMGRYREKDFRRAQHGEADR